MQVVARQCATGRLMRRPAEVSIREFAGGGERMGAWLVVNDRMASRLDSQ